MANILVVDDDAQIRTLLNEAFNQQGHAVVSVPELAQALAKIGQDEFDLVILDLAMHGEHGMSFLKNIRDAQSDIPIVIYSGFVSGGVEQELRKAGANEVISKGEGIAELLQRVEKILKVGKRLFREPVGERTLLVVDDDDAIRELLNIFFTKKKYKVLEAENGEKALSIVRLQTVDCALLDIGLPDMSGLELLPKLKSVHPDMGIVMITGDGEEAVVKKAIAMGAYGYVIKPFDFVYLELTVASRLIIAAG